MKYWYDCEFIEDGKTIDLISIGIVAEDGREFYVQNIGCNFKNASDWVARNVFPRLTHFNMATLSRNCSVSTSLGEFLKSACAKSECAWASKNEIAKTIIGFCDVELYGKPEFWGYYSAYDHVALCQIFGTMMDLPKGFPMYTRDIKQLCDSLGNPKLPAEGKGEHNALCDAQWNKLAYEFLIEYSKKAAK